MGASVGLGAPRSWDRWLQASAVLMLISVAWFLVNVAHPVGPPVLLWLATPPGAVVLAVIYRRTSKTQALSEPTRRFWRHLSIVAALVGVAATAQAIDVLARPDAVGSHMPPLMIAFDGAAVLVIVYAAFRLPLARQSKGELVRLLLDASTLMLAAATITWHFQTRQLLGDDDLGMIGMLVLTVLALIAVFAVAKVVLSSYAFIDNGALRLLALAMLLGIGIPALQPYLTNVRPALFTMMAGIPVVFFVGACAGERQRAFFQGTRRGAVVPRRRAFSMLPYLAVAVVDLLLVLVTWGKNHDDNRIIVATVVVLTALVVLRQLTAFRDNAELLDQLDHGANHDALTDLPNRILFHKRLESALSAAGSRDVSVALIDLDDFKEVNDNLGHEVGDLLLIAVAQRLNACVRAEDTVARLGGDEFVVVLDGDPAAADLAADRMIEALRRPVLADGHELPIRASIGIADGHTGDEASVLLRHADIAMYAAKNIPGTAYLHYVPAMAAAGTDHAHLGSELREAIRSEQLFLLYQPIVALDDGRLMGAEALVRWAHPTQGTLAPAVFIPLAERTGLIVPLSRWVMRTAFRQLGEWVAAYGDGAPAMLNVNISARDLREPGFATEVAALLAEHGVAADRVTIEITETMVLEPGQSIATLHHLRALGIRVSLDDFGTGHSTLTLLHDCPIDEIKLDRSFTQAQVDGRVPMAAAVIHLAQALGLHAVAEGVETAEQAEQLLSLGYIAAQGFHFAHPMSSDQLGALLVSGESLMPASAEQLPLSNISAGSMITGR